MGTTNRCLFDGGGCTELPACPRTRYASLLPLLPRVSLPIKLMLSYLLVVGMVLLPTVVWLRTTLGAKETSRARDELSRELSAITRRLAEAPQGEIPSRTRLLLATLPHRLTVTDPQGYVIGDSFRRVDPLPNHGDRPEIRDAMAFGTGWSVRLSGTTGEHSLYVAERFPRTGLPRGVARLARSMEGVGAGAQEATRTLNGAAAVALSVAVLLSLVAALAASRPLRKITVAARQLADGEFGVSIDVRTNDEIGELAQAVDSLAGQLRSRLVASGSERATLQALVDDLPVGVVLYNRDQSAEKVNAAARVLLELPPHLEEVRAAEIPVLSAQRSVVDGVLRTGVTANTTLALPWIVGRTFAARWVGVFAPDGQRVPALLVLDRAETHAWDGALVSAREVLSHALDGTEPTPARRIHFAEAALTFALELPEAPLSPDEVDGLALGALCEGAVARARPCLDARACTVRVSVDRPEVKVTDARGRTVNAVAALLVWASRRRDREALELRVAVEGDYVRVAVPGAHEPDEDFDRRLVASLGPLGGEALTERQGEGVARWLKLSLA